MTFKPTEEQRKTVRAMTAYGITQKEVAAIFGIHSDTLRLHFAHELATATAEANAAVAQKLFQKATVGDDTTAQIFWLKTRAKWSERIIIQDGDDVDYDPAALSDSDLTDRITRLRRAAAAHRATAPEDVPTEPPSLVH